MSIFKAYDIRGLYGKELDEATAQDIGKAYATYLNLDEAYVGMDCRSSSPSLANAVSTGMSECGTGVYDIGMVPTPALYYAVASRQKQGGVMVTASHNPPEYNGFKLSHGALSMLGDEIQELSNIIDHNAYKVGVGNIEKSEILPGYIDYLQSSYSGKKLKIVADFGNGMCGLVFPPVMKALGCELVSLYQEPDGRFPNHQADPTKPENISELRELVVKEKADFGVGFDGDGDRAVFIDDRGESLEGDEALILFAREMLAKTKGKIIFDIKCSKAVSDDVEQHGGTPILNRTGHSYIKRRLADENGMLAGEMSGHFFFKKGYFGYDDALYAALRMAEIVSGGRLSELRKTLPKYHSTPEIRVPCADDKKVSVIEKLKSDFSDHRLLTIDGVRVEFDDGWGLVRPSNTEPILVIRFEAKTQERLDEIQKMFRESLQRQGVSF